MPLNAPNDTFFEEVTRRCPTGVAEVAPAYLEEPRGIYNGQAAAVLKPASVADVAACVEACNRHRVGIIPYAGGTGLVGGQVREQGGDCVILSLERMDRVRSVSQSDRTMVAEAGVILANVQAKADDAGLLFPLSLASEGTCRIGGNLATNAGGVNVLRWGNARDLCLGIEAVLPDGTVFNGLRSLRKDNTGYDLRHLLIGSEGTLGIITAATLRLFPRPVETVTGLFEIAGPDAALTLLRRLQDRFGEMVSAFELIDATGVDFLRETMPDLVLPPVGQAPWLALVEIGGGAGLDLEDRFTSVLAGEMETGLVHDGHIAQSETQRQAIWTMRESIPEANRRIGAVASHDISVPIGRIPEFVGEASRAIATVDPALRVNCFGHLGDGNLHYNVYPPKGGKKADFLHLRDRVTTAVHDLVHGYDGSISAEHGIGRLKRTALVTYGDPGKLAAMRAIKRALDPHGIMNPGAVIEA